MSEKEKELLLAWIINEESRLEDEVNELQRRIKFRKIEIYDNVEMLLALQRLDDFRDFALVVLRLLHLP